MKKIIAIGIATIFLVAGIATYSYYSEFRAQKLSRQFCKSVKVGDSPDGLLERAHMAGANTRLTQWKKMQNGHTSLSVTFTGFTRQQPNVCLISASSKVVTHVKHLFN